MVFGKDIVKII